MKSLKITMYKQYTYFWYIWEPGLSEQEGAIRVLKQVLIIWVIHNQYALIQNDFYI